jgi:hypothetical protein
MNDRLVAIIAVAGGIFCLVVIPLLAIWAEVKAIRGREDNADRDR